MMTLQNQVKIWLAAAVIGLLLIWVFRGILLPFVVGLALAYLLNPVVGWLERLRIGRGWAALLVLAGVLAVIVGLFLLLVPLVAGQVGGLIELLPGYIVNLRELANQAVPALNEWLGPDRAHQLEVGLSQMLNDVWGVAGGLLAGVFSSSLNLINTLGLVIITPVVAFYLLLDWDGMQRGIDNLLPRDHRLEVQGILADLDRSMAGVIRGQGSVILVLCVYYTSALTISGLSFGLAIGLMAGLFSFIPFVGFLTGFALSMVIAFVQFWPNWVMIVAIFAVFMVGQFLEGNVLYPKLVGSSIGINPVWLMFSLFAFSLLFGFVGLLLAVPLSAISAVLLRYAIAKYKGSTLYRGRAVTVERSSEPLDSVAGE